MRFLVLAALVACGSEKPLTVKPPNDMLIVGEYERRPPDGTTAIRFVRDGSVKLAHDKGELDSKTLATGSWKLDGDKNYDGTPRQRRFGLMTIVAQTKHGVWQVVVAQNTNAIP